VDGATPETCHACGFDAEAWTPHDAATLLDALGVWWRLALADLPADAVNRRPAPGVWSALEYGQHSALVTAVLRFAIEQVLDDDGTRLPPAPEGDGPAGAPVQLDAAVVVADLDREGHALAAVTRHADPDAWAHVGHSGDRRIQADAALRHAVHDASHHLMDVSRGLAALGAGPPSATGVVVQVNASNGGVPKRAVPEGWVSSSGLEGDHQAERLHHGRPFQALCLWSLEVIEELAADGHPIAPGAAGENVTLSGLDWSTLRPGALLRVDDVLAELSFPAIPCAKQTRWFSDGDFQRISHTRNPHLARWYAWVREAGAVRPGATVVLQPTDRPHGRGDPDGRPA
jgi:MOSC domain-containing protein YiiM